MSAWGVGFLENDTAMDFSINWNELVMPCINSGLWDSHKVWIFYKNIYFKNMFNALDSEQNLEILALAELLNNNKIAMTKEFKEKLEASLASELRSEQLNEWDDPKQRKNKIIDFIKKNELNKIKVSEKSIGNINLEEEIEKLNIFVKRIKKMAKIVSTFKDVDDFDTYYPSYFNEIDKLLNYGIPQPRSHTNQELKLIKLRFMLLAFYVGWKSRFSTEEMLDIIKKAESTGGYFFLNIEIFGEKPNA